MPLFVFFSTMVLLSILDISENRIPNWIVIPMTIIIASALKTWPPAIVSFIGSALLYKEGIWAGGDVKLSAMVGAFLGWIGVIVIPLTIILILCYRKYRAGFGCSLPVAPFMTVASAIFAITGRLLGHQLPLISP